MLPIDDTTIARFWARVDKTPGHGPAGDCWVWIAGQNGKGYGTLRFLGGTNKAHRAAWAITHKEFPPPETPCVLHRCDNRLCVNPDHLWIGTNADNTADMVAKGRQRGAPGDRNQSRLYPEKRAYGIRNGKNTKPEKTPRGDAHYSRLSPERRVKGGAVGTARLTREQVLEIRDRYARGDGGYRVLAREYGVGQTTIVRVVKRIWWKHL